MTAGQRNQLIAFQRRTYTEDAYGAAVETWSLYAQEWASVRFGSAQERRSAAQESASQAATFRVLLHPLTFALTPLDRIAGFMGSTWEITGVSPYESEVEITAVRKAA